jgi:PmbA protein
MNDNFVKQSFENLCLDTVANAQRMGATSAEVSVNVASGFTVTARLGQVDTIEHHHDKGIAITVFFDHKMGSASSSDLSSKAVSTLLERACNIAKVTNSDPYAGLAEKSLIAFGYPQLDLHYPWDIDPEQGLKLALECEDIARAEDQRITNSEGVSLSTHCSFQALANTHGFLGSYPSTQHSLNCALIAQQGDQMQRDYEYTVARDPADLEASPVLAKKAAKRVVDRLGARRLKTCRVPVIFLAPLAKGLLGNFVFAISGSNIYRKSSFLLDHLDKQVFPEFIRIDQRPHIPKAIGSTPFDDEGVRTFDQDFVTKGILQSYILSSYSARKLAMQSTGNAGGIQNLFISTSNQTLDELIRHMQQGLLVTELIGQGVNIVTGDYSRGAFGFWVENGAIQFPVEEITIAGNLADMFLNIVAVANDVDHRGSIHSGSILVEHMMVAGE